MGVIGRQPPPCPECRALGSFDHGGSRYDLYFCLLRLHSLPIVDPDWPTVMARFGEGPEDFTDGIALAERDSVLGEAKRRAIDGGFYDPKKPLSPLLKPFVEALADAIVADLRKPAIGAEPGSPSKSVSSARSPRRR